MFLKSPKYKNRMFLCFEDFFCLQMKYLFWRKIMITDGGEEFDKVKNSQCNEDKFNDIFKYGCII